MSPIELLAGQARWAGENIAYNLEFVPDDRLDWKPATTAKSVIEIVNHTIGAMKGMTGAVRGGAWEIPDFQPATTRAEAQSMIREATGAYADAVQALSPEDLKKNVAVPFGTFPMSQFSSFGVVELQHHRGQICYLQTLWGDTKDHFDL
jgi:uncharacterized damage-inducible protein DinB